MKASNMTSSDSLPVIRGLSCYQNRHFETTKIIQSENNQSQESFVSWLFLVGSLMFVLDAVLENLKGVSFSSILHISASILFTIGSILFIPSTAKS